MIKALLKTVFRELFKKNPLVQKEAGKLEASFNHQERTGQQQ